jgi:iron-sulfur cluster assembly accessory protein
MADCGDVQKAFVPIKDDEIKKPATSVASLQITDMAAEKIMHFSNMGDKTSDKYGLKVGVVNDGCSGKSYTMDLAEIGPCKEKGDKVFIKNGAAVIVEKLSYMFVIGSVLDYQESLLASGFQLTNPNVKGSCSCGSSFKI